MSLAHNPHEGYFEHNSSNGEGYVMYQPPEDAEQQASLSEVVNSLTFAFSPIYISAVDSNSDSNLSIIGGPGAGKSHLTKDFIINSIGLQRPVFALKSHVAFGKKSTLREGSERLMDFASSQQQRPLIIVDNVDYFGYKGTHRTRPAAELALDTFGEAILALASSGEVSVIGISHTPDWRETHWSESWGDINERSEEILNALGEPEEFNGEMDYKRALRHLGRIGVGPERAKRILNAVQAVTGELLFRHIHHLDKHLRGAIGEGDQRRRSDDESLVAEAIESINAGTRKKLKIDEHQVA